MSLDVALPSARVRVFWQPGCTSCLRTKEFLTRHGVQYESVNVQDDADGMDSLLALGARSVPVVSLGSNYVYAQSLNDVIGFLGLNLRPNERLAPEVLVQRAGIILRAALRFVAQIPADKLEADLRNRKRSIRQLAHHVFRIPQAFLEAAAGATLTYESTVQEPDDAIVTCADIARYGAGVLARFEQWWGTYADKSCTTSMDTYYGVQPMHEVLERTTWHSAQHTRQLMMLLEMLAITPDGLLLPEHLTGLPLPEKVWDD